MIIHTPEIDSKDNYISVSSRIEFKKPLAGFPESPWFKFLNNDREDVSSRSDSFAVSLLLLAMTLGEDIDVRGLLSPR